MVRTKIYTTWAVEFDADAENPLELLESITFFPWRPLHMKYDSPEGRKAIIFDSYAAAEEYMVKLFNEAEEYEQTHLD